MEALFGILFFVSLIALVIAMVTEPEKRVAVHLDNQFRLLREDMLAELRNDLQISLKKKQGKRRKKAAE